MTDPLNNSKRHALGPQENTETHSSSRQIGMGGLLWSPIRYLVEEGTVENIK